MIKKFTQWTALVASTSASLQAAMAATDITTNTDLIGTQINSSINTSGGLFEMIGSVINYLLGLLGLITFIFLLYGGFTILTAQGSEDKVAEGRKILMYTILGAVIIGLAYAINNWVFGLTGVFVQ